MSRSWVVISCTTAIAVAAVAGCGSSGPEVSKTVTSRTRVPGAKPVNARGVAAALRQHGFRFVTTKRPEGGSAIAEVDSGEGFLGCRIYDPGTSWEPVIEVRGPGPHSGLMWQGTKAYVFYMNMECQLYPTEGREREQTDRLVAAVRKVAGLGPAGRG